MNSPVTAMHFEPRDVFLKLEFDKVVELLKREALTPMAEGHLAGITPSTDFDGIDRALKEVREFKLALEKNDRFPLTVFHDLSPDLKMLEIAGYTLQVETFQHILRLLQQIREVFKFFGTGPKKEIYPRMFDIVRPLSFDEGLIKALLAVFDEKGELRPDASVELLQIRKAMSQKVRELDGRFRQIVQELRSKGLLSDNPESFRNGRRVLSVPAEHKRKIKGIIHDESDTGRTVYIEPEPVVEINNDLFDLEQEERREIYRILRQLSDQIRPYGPALGQYLQALIRFDVLQAKARLALAMRANMPVLKNQTCIGIKKGYHPLLYLKNKNQQKKTIPFELRLSPEHHMLILSGPNAGGKSIAMKSVGLLQIMLQSGLLVPVHELSEMGIFDQLFADIGDQQSLEDDLSTYSSRLQNARTFIQKANPKTLVLIDEFGSGTDPKPGGAIAEAILRQLHRKGVFGIITTHYSNLKVFAFRNPGILNGNMHFDKDTLSPTYEMRIGRPGSSYAFEIAAKSGLPKDLIDYARNRTGSETAVDDILVDLQREKQTYEEQLRVLKGKEENLDRLIKTYDSLHHELEVKRKRLKLDQKEHELRQSAQATREIDKIVRTLKEEKNLEKAQQLSAQLRQERADKARAVHEINEEVVNLEERNKPVTTDRALQVGDFVRLRAGGAVGQIARVQGSKAEVQLGDLRVTAPLRDLLPAAAPLHANTTPATNSLQQAADFESKIDLRGMSKEEAFKVLEKFVDNSLLSNAAVLRILHGKGNGVLRTFVKQKLREYGNHVVRVYHPEQENGGDGVTIVELA